MADDTPPSEIIWYQCPVCTESYDIDYLNDSNGRCVVCNATEKERILKERLGK